MIYRKALKTVEISEKGSTGEKRLLLIKSNLKGRKTDSVLAVGAIGKRRFSSLKKPFGHRLATLEAALLPQ